MKRITLTALGFLFLANSDIQAQWKLGGNNLTTAEKIGSNTGYSVIFETNNLERGRVTGAGLWGLGVKAPNAKLHVNSTSSQIPFRVQVNGVTKFLAHNAGGVSIGANVVPPSNGLYVFGPVGIGTNSPAAKLHVEGGGISMYGNSSTGTGVQGQGATYGVYGSSENADGAGVFGTGKRGVYGTGSTYGVNGYSSTSTGVYGNGNVGVYGRGTDTGIYGVGSSYGVYGFTSSGIGVFGTSNSNIAVWGSSFRNYGGNFYSSSNHGLWAETGSTASGVYAGAFKGNVFTYGSYLPSDKEIKKNIQDFGNAIDIINKLNPKYYQYREDGKYASLQLPKGNHYGLLAQDLEQVLPNLVNEMPFALNSDTQVNNKPQEMRPSANEDLANARIDPQPVTRDILNTKAVNYTELIPIMIKAMQEQQQTINILTDKIAKLEAGGRMSGSNNSEHSGSLGVSLEQNTPNPVNSTTTFRYTVPANATAQILVYNSATGKLVKTLQAPASGEIQMNGNDLPAGNYIYTLVVNGKQVASKQLILSR
ncbi:hypothetical protein AHMF7605_21805 [Adhaeribacter arboris]|uniref:Peptidase S74 domain-containing protein n=1 Tax=Adhaeribacter arboris TaxID=2072846 RepID=A0A2T2YKA7_9BACT|nr:tail fiber domain-containing protein [Adhaeribacter arboris]PSR55947.1 hypothetical protein AHMF7605_21805 [Adhaeribacter arboris]